MSQQHQRLAGFEFEVILFGPSSPATTPPDLGARIRVVVTNLGVTTTQMRFYVVSRLYLPPNAAAQLLTATRK